MKTPRLSIEVITKQKPIIASAKAHGWGDGATTTNMIGDVMEIQISRDGKIQFGFRIQENGRIMLTDYAGMGYTTFVSDLALHPSRPWTKKKL